MPVRPRTTYTPVQRQVLNHSLRMLARMIAQAYLRDVRGAAASTTGPTSMPDAPDLVQPDAARPSGATTIPDASD